jgi:hypothetical protein
VTGLLRLAAQVSADLYASGCSVLAAVTFPDQVVL